MNKVKEVRKSLKMTQKELADKLSLTQAAVAKIETNEKSNPSIDMAFKIADALDTNVYELFSIDNSENKLALNKELISNLKKEKRLLESFRASSLNEYMINAFGHSSMLWDAHKDLEKLDEDRSRYYKEAAISVVVDFTYYIRSYYQTGFISEENLLILKSRFPFFEKHPLYRLLKDLDSLSRDIDFIDFFNRME